VRIVLFGATGRIGSATLQQALSRGHQVAVLVRHPDRLQFRHERLRVLKGDARRRPEVVEVAAGAEAAISALGPRRNTPEDADAHLQAVRTVLEALEATGVSRIVAVLGAAVDAPGDRKGAPDRIAGWLVRRFARWVYEAKRQEFDLLRESRLDWTAVRPPLVVPGPPTGTYGARLDRPPRPRIRTGDLAEFLVREVEEGRHVRQAPFVA